MIKPTDTENLIQSNESSFFNNSRMKISFFWAGVACLLTLFIVPKFIEDNVELLIMAIWLGIFIITYLLHSHFQHDEQETFDFYKVSEKIEQPNIFESDILKVSKPTMDTPFLIDEDGLDPSIVFNVEKTGAATLILIEEITQGNNFTEYLLAKQVSVKLIGSPIEGVRLMEMQYQGMQGYYRLTNNELYPSDSSSTCNIDIAFLHDTDVLRLQVEKAVLDMLNDHTPGKATKFNASNYQAMFKFYTYVQRLRRPENRSVNHLCFYHGTFEISNSSYVELYNCNLKSSLTSWVNKDGLIRTDYLDEEEQELSASEKETLQTTIGLPFAKCRLIDIYLIKILEDSLSVKLHLSFSELCDDQPTGKENSLTIVMKDKNILISRDQEETTDLISVSEYFNEKTIIPFYPAC